MPVVTEAKTLIEAIENAKNELKTEKIFYLTEEKKSLLLKGKMYKVTAISYQELIEETKAFIKKITDEFEIDLKFETNIKDEQFYISMYSNNNNLLIGKNGNTLKSLETICRAKIKKEWGISPKIILDVENYREKRIETLERLAIKIAKEVRETKINATLENMNSYERRIIHNKLTNFKGISTTSEGEEPNRHIIIRAE